jgi:acyl-CoA synthetase (AMP-forming)/AMP-acid ligase II
MRRRESRRISFQAKIKEYFNKPEASLKAFKNICFHTGDACYKNNEGIYFFGT